MAVPATRVECRANFSMISLLLYAVALAAGWLYYCVIVVRLIIIIIMLPIKP
jgi:hypothetical protein